MSCVSRLLELFCHVDDFWNVYAPVSGRISYPPKPSSASVLDSFVDATPIPVCKHPRIPQHRVCVGLARRGKNSVGWFFGFKQHLIVNHHGELLAYHRQCG